MSHTNPAAPPTPPHPPPASGRRIILRGLLVAALLFGGVYALFAVDTGRGPIGRLYSDLVSGGPSIMQPPPEFRELIDANQQHLQIAAIVAACHPGVEATAGAPPAVGQVLLLGLNPYGGYDHGRGDDTAVSAPVLTPFQAAVIRLSDATARGRVQSARVATDQGARMATYQWAAVAIGAITTILVGLRSVSGIPIPTTLGALAIVFSALGTGCTTINSFFAPAEVFGRADRALAQLRLLHRERAIALLMGPDVCATGRLDPEQPSDLRARFVRDWNARLTETINAAGASAQPASGGTGQSGQQGTGGQGGGQGGAR